MIVADTSIWIEFFKKRDPYFKYMLFLLTHREIYSMEIIFAELLQGAKNRYEREMILAYWNDLPRLTPTELYIRAGYKSEVEKWPSKGIGLIDSAIINGITENNLRLWTLDKKIKRILQRKQKYIPRLKIDMVK